MQIKSDTDLLPELEAEPWFIPADEVAIGDKIAAGAEGIVRLAKWKGKKVVVKSSVLYFFGMRSSFATFSTEISTFTKLRSPQIVTFYGVTYAPELGMMLVLEHCPRGSLYQLLHDKTEKRPRPLPGKIKVHLLQEICYGMQYLHGMQPPLIHRDLKSSNILITEEFGAKITDFGMTADEQDDKTQTKNIGTASYSAPEMFDEEKAVRYSVKVDVYAFGIIAWEILEEKVPYENFDMNVRIIMNVLSGNRPEIPEDMPQPVAQLLRDCWTANPKARPSFAEILSRMKAGIRDDILQYTSQ
eukprot:TRINITY_DN11192_c0_g1_i1.p1 TRINITY_DN11192_c0_g1~~TRINITY_DN11192_c0_g1_i1.p1  ORF type:complete len:300 (+),score=47.56 TRINITY_DN11192_c0_g1_i1:92-991(+)